jgi:hypothetical protein
MLKKLESLSAEIAKGIFGGATAEYSSHTARINAIAQTYFPPLGRIVEVDYDVSGYAVLVTGLPSKLAMPIRFLRTRNLGVNVMLSLEDVISTFKGGRNIPSLLVVDIDSVADEDLTFDLIFTIREKYPQLPVILISGGFARDDMSTERLAICDVSLRAPINRASFEMGLEEAFDNNSIWQHRLVELNLRKH